MASPLRVVGTRAAKLDAPAKATGAIRYADDLVLPRMLHGALTRSDVAHADVVAVDVDEARSIPGIVAVLSSADVEDVLGSLAPYDPACHDFERSRPFEPTAGDARLLGRRVRYVGEPIAAVAAEDAATARCAADLVVADLAPLPAALDPAAARTAHAPAIHDGVERNLATSVARREGDPDAALEAATVVVRRRFVTSRQKQAQLEPTCCVVDPDPQDGFTVYSPVQAPHRARFTLAHLFGVDASRVRVVNTAIGGAFGKGDALTAEPHAAALALVTGRPVKLRYSRNEDFVGTEARHPCVADMTGGFDADGRLVALRAHVTMDAGAYLSHSPRIAAVVAGQLMTVYRIPNVDITVDVVFTNSPVNGAFRGYGGPQAAFSLEQLIDLGAREVGVNPADARRVMLADDPDRTTLLRCLEAVVQRAPRPARETEGAPERPHGVGIACTRWKSGIADKPGAVDQSGAIVHLHADGTVDVITAACDLGTGVKTALAQVCAEVLGLDLGSIRVSDVDTAATPFDSGAHASRSLYRAGQAVQAAATDVRDQVLAYAAEVLEADPSDLEFADGAVRVRGAAQRHLGLPELLHRALFDGHDFHGHGQAPKSQAPTAAAHLAEVEVDLETGRVDVVRLVAVQDVGRAINPTLVEGQIEGAVHQGIGYAITEGLVLDRDTGVVLNGSYMDYRLLTATDTPLIEAVVLEAPDPTGPFGAKGVGEPGIILPAAAIANAIRDAADVTIDELPMTPERVHRALTAADRPPETSETRDSTI